MGIKLRSKPSAVKVVLVTRMKPEVQNGTKRNRRTTTQSPVIRSLEYSKRFLRRVVNVHLMFWKDKEHKECSLNYPGAEARRREKVSSTHHRQANPLSILRNAGELPTNIQLRRDWHQETIRVELGAKKEVRKKGKLGALGRNTNASSLESPPAAWRVRAFHVTKGFATTMCESNLYQGQKFFTNM